MAPAKDKWIKRFIITETRRHKRGFTIYKVTSIIFLKSSHEELSKVSVWKRYNDFKKLHSELGSLHKRLGIKEPFPAFPKSKYFGRFEAEVVEERKRYVLKFLEFIGRHSYLYSSDTFITFFETSHADNYANYCAHSLCSDTSEDDLIAPPLNHSAFANDTAAQNALQALSKTSRNVLTTNQCSALPNIYKNENEFATSQRNNESRSAANLQIVNVKREEPSYKREKSQNTITRDADIKNKNVDEDGTKALMSNVSGFDSVNNNVENLSNCNTRCNSISQEKTITSYQTQAQDFTQYLLVAAAHMSAAFKHESIAEYEEAFTQYKLGISCLINGVQFDSDSTRVPSIKDKISQYLARAEQLYNRHLNCNVSIVSKPVSELQYYKVLKIIKSVMLVMDIRANCNRIIKTVERSSIHEDNTSNYVLRGQVPCMVHLYACIETETTVFLILQYASCGKLMDFVRLHYAASDHLHNDMISNHVYKSEYINQDISSNEDIHESSERQVVDENNKWSKDHRYSVDVLNEISMEVPTVQLLEKSQKLLQSVNATLKKSNSIANRLNESKGLKHSKNTVSMNVYQESDCILSDNYCNKSNNIKTNDITENLSTESFTEEKGANSLSDNSNISENIRESVLSKSRTTPNSFPNKINDLFYKDSSPKNVSMQNLSTDNIYVCKNNNIKDAIDRANSCKEHTMDEEKVLWQIPEAVIRSWAVEILLALEALHQQNVLILDFKPDNILLDDAGHVKLTYIVPQRNVELSKLTHPYSSPESAMYSPISLVTSATDIWSFGVILYELLTGIMFIVKHPGLFHSHSTINIPGKLSENARSLLNDILKYHPNERLTIDEIKRHPFFAGIDWSGMDNS